MLEYKVSTSVKLPLRLTTAAGTGVTGKLNADITCTVRKADGTSSTIASGSRTLTEVTTGAFSGLGYYELQILDTTASSAVGVFTYAVTVSGAEPYVGLVRIVSHDEGDIFSNTGNRLEIHTSGTYANHMTIYDTDGITAKYRYALYNRNGEPSTVDIYKRVPVPL